MRFVLTVEMDNAAFGLDGGRDGASGWELARILKEAAAWVHGQELVGGEVGTVRDINGNKVCAWKVEE